MWYQGRCALRSCAESNRVHSVARSRPRRGPRRVRRIEWSRIDDGGARDVRRLSAWRFSCSGRSCSAGSSAPFSACCSRRAPARRRARCSPRRARSTGARAGELYEHRQREGRRASTTGRTGDRDGRTGSESDRDAELRTKIDDARDRLKEQVAEASTAAKPAVDKAADAAKGGIETAEQKARTPSTRGREGRHAKDKPAETAAAPAAPTETTPPRALGPHSALHCRDRPPARGRPVLVRSMGGASTRAARLAIEGMPVVVARRRRVRRLGAVVDALVPPERAARGRLSRSRVPTSCSCSTRKPRYVPLSSVAECGRGRGGVLGERQAPGRWRSPRRRSAFDGRDRDLAGMPVATRGGRDGRTVADARLPARRPAASTRVMLSSGSGRRHRARDPRGARRARRRLRPESGAIVVTTRRWRRPATAGWRRAQARAPRSPPRPRGRWRRERRRRQRRSCETGKAAVDLGKAAAAAAAATPAAKKATGAARSFGRAVRDAMREDEDG